MSLQLLGKNTVIYAFGNIILRIGAFLLIPIYTNYLSIEEYGILATLIVSIEVLTIIMNGGMKNSLVRFFDEYFQNKNAGRLIGTSILVNIISGIIVAGICVFFLTGFFKSILHSTHLGYIIELTCAAALMEALYFHAVSFYRAKNEAFKFLYFGISTFILLFSLNYIFIVIFGFGIQGVLYARILSYCVVFCVILGHIIFQVGISISFPLMNRLLKFGFPLIFSISGEKLIQMGMLYLLSFYAGLREVAIFSLGLKFASILSMVIILPAQLSLPPYIYANLKKLNIKENLSRFFTYLVMALTAGSLVVIVFSKAIIPIISPPEYWMASQIVVFLVPAILIRSFKIYGEAFLNVTHKTYITGSLVGSIGLMSLIINYFFIIHWGLNGLIVAYNLVHISLAIFLFGYGTSAYPIVIEWKRIQIIFIWFIVFISGSYFSLRENELIFYLVSVLLGFSFLIYMIFSHFLNQQEREYLNSLYSKLQLKFFS